MVLYGARRVPKAKDLDWRRRVNAHTVCHFGCDNKAHYRTKNCGCAVAFQEQECNVFAKLHSNKRVGRQMWYGEVQTAEREQA